VGGNVDVSCVAYSLPYSLACAAGLDGEAFPCSRCGLGWRGIPVQARNVSEGIHLAKPTQPRLSWNQQMCYATLPPNTTAYGPLAPSTSIGLSEGKKT
jgi:hypothetical protein